ncbi:hypothetical protein ABBQ38_013691 [Trebouxia sp. C0009 RCD-2024]
MQPLPLQQQPLPPRPPRVEGAAVLQLLLLQPLQTKQPLPQLLLLQPQEALQPPLLLHLPKTQLLLPLLLPHLAILLLPLLQLHQLADTPQLLLQLHLPAQEEEEEEEEARQLPAALHHLGLVERYGQAEGQVRHLANLTAHWQL